MYKIIVHNTQISHDLQVYTCATMDKVQDFISTYSRRLPDGVTYKRLDSEDITDTRLSQGELMVYWDSIGTLINVYKVDDNTGLWKRGY